MKSRYRILLTAAVLAGFSLGTLGLSLARPVVSTWIDRSVAQVGFRISQIELDLFRSKHRRTQRIDEQSFRQIEHLKNPGTMLWGAYDDALPRTFGGVLALERSLGTRMNILQLYIGWGDAAEQEFPLRAAQAIWGVGSVPLITWEPWLAAFDASLHPSLPPPRERDKGGLRAIAAGNYDFYLRAWADGARDFGCPLFVRLAHEMNDGHRYPWGPVNNPNSGDFRDAWRHVVTLFRARGATNVLFVWAPSISYPEFECYFPGREWVDWVGTGVLNFGDSARWSKWASMDELLGVHYPTLVAWSLPLMIAEFGSVAKGGDRPKWYRDSLVKLAAKYAGVKAVLFFNVREDRTTTSEPLDWAIGTNNVADAIRDGISAGFDHAVLN